MNAEELKRRYCLEAPDLPNPAGLNVVQVHDFTSTPYPTTDGNGRAVTGVRNELWFRGYQLPLRLNNTRIDVLTAMFGKETEDWIGRKIGLYLGAGNNYGKTEVTIYIHIQPCDEADLTPPKQIAMAPQQAPAFGGGRTANRQPPAPAGSPALPPFDVRPLTPNSVDSFKAAMADQGLGIEDCLRWFKKNSPKSFERAWGQELADWPRGLGGEMQRFLREYSSAPAEPAATAPQPQAPASPAAPPADARPPVKLSFGPPARNQPQAAKPLDIDADDIPF